jgi:hypothetical protein
VSSPATRRMFLKPVARRMKWDTPRPWTAFFPDRMEQRATWHEAMQEVGEWYGRRG